MRLREKKGTKVPHALSVKLCMRSHGCQEEVVRKNGEVMKLKAIKSLPTDALKKFMDADGVHAMFYKKKDVEIPGVGKLNKDKFKKLSAEETKEYVDKYGYDFLDGVDLSK